MDNPEEVLHILDEFAKLKPKDIPKELEDYLSYVARTGDPVYQWSLVKCLFREKLLRVITDFYESTALLNPPSPAGDSFNYEGMKRVLLERLETFSNAPFTVQRLCELLTAPRKQYNRTDKFMRAIEKNILVVSTREPGAASRQENALTEPLANGVTDGESVSPNISNDTLHLESHLNPTQESIAVGSLLTDENHVDIGTNELEGPKDFDPVSVELSHSSDQVADKQVIGGVPLEDVCSVPANSEAHSELGHQTDNLQNIESLGRTEDSCVDQTDADSTEHSEVEHQIHVGIEESANQESLPPDQELVDSLKDETNVEENVPDTALTSESKDEGVPTVDTSNSENEVEKPFVEESDVSCSSSDTQNVDWPECSSKQVPEPDVSTSEASSDPSEPVEELSGPSSSDDSKESLVQPESSGSPELSSEKAVADNAVSEVLTTIDSSSDNAEPVVAQDEVEEEDVVGTTDEVIDQSSSKTVETVEEPESQSSELPEFERVAGLEVPAEVPTEAILPEESKVAEEATSLRDVEEAKVVEDTSVSSEAVNVESKSDDVNTDAVPSTNSEANSEEAAPSASDEAMDVDEANSCHSTGAGTEAEAEAMTVADQSEPMDDSE